MRRPARQIEQMGYSADETSFDQLPLSELKASSLDLEKADRAFRSEGNSIDRRRATSLGLLIPVGNRQVPSMGGLILFGRLGDLQRLCPDARVACARFRGSDKVHFLDRYDVEGSIIDAVDQVPKFIARNTRLAAKIEGMRRQDIPEYPVIAVREALINALAHADYTLGSHIQIAIYNDRLEIQNPGALPSNIKSGISQTRNRVIVRVFRELGWVKAEGGGYKQIMADCRQGGYPVPDWIKLGTTTRVTFYPHPDTQLDRP